MKKLILAVIVVFVALSVMDFVLHGLILGPTYEATAELWRPMEEIKAWQMHVVTFLLTIPFVLIYCHLIDNKSLANGIKYGVLFGLASGITRSSEYHNGY